MNKRIFIAFPFSESIKTQISQLQVALRSEFEKGIKWVDIDSFHITVKFLGNTDTMLIPKIIDIIEMAAHQQQTIEIDLANLGVFPHQKNPKVLWLGTCKGKSLFQNTHSYLEQQLQNLGFKKETKFGGFHPHVTLGRVKYLPNNFSSVFAKHCKSYVATCSLDSIVLYESKFVTTSTGKKAMYQPLATAKLS